MINADGDAEIYLMISKERNAENFFEMGIRKEIDLKLKIQNPVHVTTENFQECILECFIPTFIQEIFCNEKENFSAYFDENHIKILAENHILVITYLHIPLMYFKSRINFYLVFLKKHKKYIPKNDDCQPSVNHIYRIFHANELRLAQQQYILLLLKLALIISPRIIK